MKVGRKLCYISESASLFILYPSAFILFPLVRNPRLSVVPVTDEAWQTVQQLMEN